MISVSLFAVILDGGLSLLVCVSVSHLCGVQFTQVLPRPLVCAVFSAVGVGTRDSVHVVGVHPPAAVLVRTQVHRHASVTMVCTAGGTKGTSDVCFHKQSNKSSHADLKNSTNLKSQVSITRDVRTLGARWRPCVVCAPAPYVEQGRWPPICKKKLEVHDSSDTVVSSS